MSFMGNLKHTLSIGVRVTTNEATSGFRDVAAEAQRSIEKQRKALQDLRADVEKFRGAEAAAKDAGKVARAAASTAIAKEQKAYNDLTRTIEEQRRALARLREATPKRSESYSQEYLNAKATNAELTQQIAKIRAVEQARKAAAKAEADGYKQISAEYALGQRRAAVSYSATAGRHNASLEALRLEEFKSKTQASPQVAAARTAYDTRAAALQKTRDDMADVRLQRAVSQGKIKTGMAAIAAMKSELYDTQEVKEVFSQINARAKSRVITKEEAAKQRRELYEQGIFPTQKAARRFAAEGKVEALFQGRKITDLQGVENAQRLGLRGAKESLLAASTDPEAARRAAQRVALTESMLSAKVSAAQARSNAQDYTLQGQQAAAYVRNNLAAELAVSGRQIADLEGRRVIVPERGQSEAARLNAQQIAATKASIDAKVRERQVVEAALDAAKKKQDQEVVNNRISKENAAKELAAAREKERAARASVKADEEKAAAARASARALRSQLVGAITAATVKLSMAFQFIRTMLNATRSAENFEFSARSVSALLGERRPAGEALYNQYLAKYGSTQGEVMPVAAMDRMKQLAAAGYSKSSMVDNTAAIFDVMLASAGELTEQSAADLGISLERAFGSLRMDMRAALDTAVKAANQFPMTVGNIRDALGYATEAAVQSGQSLEETLLVIGSIMPIAKTASKAGTITRNALLSLVKPESQQILSELGVRPVDAEGKRRPMMDVFLDLNDQLLEVAKGKASKYYRSPERIAEEKAAAKAAGVKYEPKSLDKVFKNQLGLEREQLEYKLTGVRGGAIFAAVNRMVETTMEKTKGTAFEGMRAADARTAFEFLRIGLSGAAGEASRLAGELRRTSKMLGESFDASLERFKIALGTAALPMKDAFLSVSKELLDKFTNFLTPEPGVGAPYTPGSSVGLNTLGTLGGIATAGATGYGVYQVGKALFQAKAIIGTVSASMATTTAASGSLAGAFSGLASFLTGPFGIAIGLAVATLVSFRTGIDAAYKSVTDFSDYLDRQNKARTQKEERALGAMFEALAAGKLGIGASGQVTGLNRGQMFDIAEAGPLAASVARFIAGGGDPTKAGEFYNEARRQVVAKQYAGSPELPAQLEALKVDEKRIIEEVMPKLIRTLFTSPDYNGGKGDRGTFGPDQLYSAYQVTKLNQAQRGYAPFASEFPTGGTEVELRKQFMEQQGAKTMKEAMSKAWGYEKILFNLGLENVPLNERLRPESKEKFDALIQLKRDELQKSSMSTFEKFSWMVSPGYKARFRLNKLDPIQQVALDAYKESLMNRPEALTSKAQLDEQDRYRPAISAEARYKNPLIEAFLSTVGEDKNSMARIPELVDPIKAFLAKAATESGQQALERALLNLQLSPADPPIMSLNPEQ